MHAATLLNLSYLSYQVFQHLENYYDSDNSVISSVRTVSVKVYSQP